MKVSILVLMEAVLQSEIIEVGTEIKQGFNPCFNGSRSAIRLIFPFIWQINALYASVYRGIGENQPSAIIVIRIHHR